MAIDLLLASLCPQGGEAYVLFLDEEDALLVIPEPPSMEAFEESLGFRAGLDALTLGEAQVFEGGQVALLAVDDAPAAAVLLLGDAQPSDAAIAAELERASEALADFFA